MPTYTFRPIVSQYISYWIDPAIWTGGVVPNGVDADVDLPAVTYAGTTSPYVANIVIAAPTRILVNSMQLDHRLEIGGTFTANSDVNVYQNASIAMSGGSFTAASATFNGLLTGSGQVSVGNLQSNGSISATGALTLNTSSFSGSGSLDAGTGILSVNTSSGGFSNLSGGTLTAGGYSVGDGGKLSLNVGGVVSRTDATISLGGSGQITSTDPLTGREVQITESLHQIGPNGNLVLAASYNTAPYSFGALNVSGKLQLGGSMSSTNLTIAPGGLISAQGVIAASIVNNGVLSTNGDYHYQSQLLVTGSVSGGGIVQIGQVDAYGQTLEIRGALTQNVVFQAPGTLTLGQPAAYQGLITPTGQGDRIVLSGVQASSITGVSYTGTTTGGTLTLQQGSATQAYNFQGNFTLASFNVSAGPQVLSSDPPSTQIVIGQNAGGGPFICFAAGTRISTPAGAAPVETLREGDDVVTWNGAIKRISWIGSTRHVVSLAVEASFPVLIRRNAFADGVPSRDLRVSQGHSFFFDGILIPAHALVNGRSISWDKTVAAVVYHHVALTDHDLLVAEGAPAESYRDDGNLAYFDATRGRCANMSPLAPVMSEGHKVDTVWTCLNERAGGAVAGLTDDPDVHIIVDGKRIDPQLSSGRYHFALEQPVSSICLMSRSVIPALVGTARDHRRLGIAISRLTLIAADGTSSVIDFSSERLGLGFHEAEPHGLRWTNGAGMLPLGSGVSCLNEIVVEVACLARYLT